MTEKDLLKSALHDRHEAMEARMGEEAGWRVPLSFRGALEEVAELRRRAGAFDLSHFGRLRIRGEGALELLERACTADVARQEDDITRWTLLCNEGGGIVDRCRLVRLEDFWVLETSPLCRLKVLGHLQALAAGLDVKVDDQTDKTALLAVAGPDGPKILDAVLPFKVGHLAAGSVKAGSLLIARYIAERVDLGGLWGVQVAVPNMVAAQAWRFITQKAGEMAVHPCGLAAWDVLRIEAGCPRYGHELNETVDPFTAGLAEEVSFTHRFLGAEALEAAQRRPAARRLIGLVLGSPAGGEADGGIPRQGAGVYRPDGTEVGTVTSGTFSVLMDAPVALAYVSAEASSPKELLVEVGGQKLPARVMPLPFAPPIAGEQP